MKKCTHVIRYVNQVDWQVKTIHSKVWILPAKAQRFKNGIKGLGKFTVLWSMTKKNHK